MRKQNIAITFEAYEALKNYKNPDKLDLYELASTAILNQIRNMKFRDDKLHGATIQQIKKLKIHNKNDLTDEQEKLLEYQLTENQKDIVILMKICKAFHHYAKELEDSIFKIQTPINDKNRKKSEIKK